MYEYALITDAGALREFVDDIQGANPVGIDTEFVRERTYNARLCLLQVAAGDRFACIDPIACEDLEPLSDLLANSDVTKIFHAARQDLEVLYQRMGFVVGPVFDTQVAAAMCGYGDQIGYAGLVERVTGVQLAKEETRTDWSRRPLTDAQLEYAVADVAHLHDLHEDLCDALEHRGRLEWLDEEHAALADTALYVVDPEDAWRRVKGLGALSARDQHLAARLARWREHEAQQRDLPREWVVRDRALLDIVRSAITDIDQLADVEEFGRRTRDRYGDAIVDMMREPVDADASALVSRGMRPDRQFNATRKRMMETLRQRAEEERIAPSLLGNRDTVERFLRDPEDSPLLKGWRRSLIGEALLEIRASGS